MVVYVDYRCLEGNETMQKLTEKTLPKFDSKTREWDSFEFFGTTMKTVSPGKFIIGQEAYTKRLKLIPSDSNLEKFRSKTYRAIVAWIGQTRPDICYAINKATQVTRETFALDNVNALNTAVFRVKRTSNTCLSYGELDKDTLHIRVYADASFETNDELSPQLG